MSKNDNKDTLKETLSVAEYISLTNEIADMYFDVDGEYQPHIGDVSAIIAFYKYCVITDDFDDLFKNEKVSIFDTTPLVTNEALVEEYNEALRNPQVGLNFACAYRAAKEIVEMKKSSLDRAITLAGNMLNGLIDKISPVLTEENIAKVSQIADDIGKGNSGAEAIVKAYADNLAKDETGE